MPQLGYILNIYDAINFDIGLEDISFRGVLSEKYTYKQDGREFLGISYRCRLKGLEYKPNVRYSLEYKQSKMDVVKLIDRLNGWMICRWFSVDTYKRLIVQLTNPVTDELLTNYLLDTYPSIFQRYKSGSKKSQFMETDLPPAISSNMSHQTYYNHITDDSEEVDNSDQSDPET